MNTTTIYLVRHAHAEWTRDETRPLSAAGRDAAGLLAARLASRPLVAIYSSPATRALETVAPLARRLGLDVRQTPDLGERALPVVPPADFAGLVREAWEAPGRSPRGGESNVAAQARGLAALGRIVRDHLGQQAVVGTHGNLLALMLNGLDPGFGYEFWCRLSFPDVYRLTFEGSELGGVERDWDDGD